MVRIKQADYERISKDYRGIWNGKRTVFAGCISKDGHSLRSRGDRF